MSKVLQRVFFLCEKKTTVKETAQYMFSWDPRKILYLCISNILNHVFNMYLYIIFSVVDFSPYYGNDKNACDIRMLISQKTKRWVVCLKGVKGQQIINKAEYSSSEHAFAQRFICIILCFCLIDAMTLWF